MEELTLTTPALLFSAVSLIFTGLYQPFFIVCTIGTTLRIVTWKIYRNHG